jgi:hypothetical protein
MVIISSTFDFAQKFDQTERFPALPAVFSTLHRLNPTATSGNSPDFQPIGILNTKPPNLTGTNGSLLII